MIKEQIRKVRSCKLEELYKQILSDRSIISFRLNEIKNDGELCQLIQNLFRINFNNEIVCKKEIIDKETAEIIEEVNISEHLENSFRHISEADPDQLYIRNDRALTDISQAIFGNWSLIGNSLKFYAEKEELGKNKNGIPKKLTSKEQEMWLKHNYFSFGTIHKALQSYFNQFDANELDKEPSDAQNSANAITVETKELAENKPLFEYFKSFETSKKNKETNAFEKVSLLKSVKSAFQPALEMLKKYENEGGEKLKNEKTDVEKIKIYLDALMDLLHFLKPLYVELSRKEEMKAEVFEKDTGFYDDFDKAYNTLKQIIPLYNQTRNHLTKKPFSVEKYKLNFDNSTLAAGWDKNKETANTAVILIKDGKYFLAIMTKEYNKLFQTEPHINTAPAYKKMDYKLLPGASKMLPKVFFSNKNIDYYNPSKEVLHIRNHGTHTKNGRPQKGFTKQDFTKKDCHTMVNFYKNSISRHAEWKEFNFEFSQTNSYNTIDEFYREVEQKGYKITFSDISESYINQCVKEGKLYLFEIYSKDFSKHSKGKPNLQTLYWKEIFSERNLKNVVYKLNGEAELFFRKASIQYPDIVWKEGHHKNDPLKKQKYPIIKDRRYAKDTFLFHCPVTCNFKAQGIPRFNDKVNTFLKNNPDVNILGIDRGERHLAYWTLINQKREIIKQGSFNNPQGKKDYHDLLDIREKERDKARKSWSTIEKIKDLKAGYLSLLVHKIAKMVEEHNAIVVFEDLNFGFKRGRFKVEKQIYQKLEKALIDKLNYLVFKDKNTAEAGGVLNGLQLTAPFESFQKMGKQTGVVFYVPAYHTSKVCPATGFVNLLYPRYETIKKSQEFFKNFCEIKFNSQEDYFEFSFNYEKFTKKAEGSRQNWTLYTYGERLENYRNSLQNNQWDTREVKLTEAFKKLFNQYVIDFNDGTDIKDQIVRQTEGKFFRQLTHLLKLTLQLRNSRINSDEDWMISPVRGNNGTFFDSRKEDSKMPENADANGAYHIGLKGLWVLEQINNQEEGKKLSIAITNKEWYQFIQDKKYQE
ncbi:MAG: type V CRISPR-associated protein Cas12a/Cpf1 [Flavobacteriaceae bacterium]|nr:type V CRISPR-associated protein Cas12a/Cpf1 [Flavobacteriaceae bacterium]